MFYVFIRRAGIVDRAPISRHRSWEAATLRARQESRKFYDRPENRDALMEWVVLEGPVRQRPSALARIEMNSLGHLEVIASNGRSLYIQGEQAVQDFLDDLPSRRAQDINDGYWVQCLVDSRLFNQGN
jgi:hypothetical protein